jgi:protocatechuate 3,4-dioxygenase beta subunit
MSSDPEGEPMLALCTVKDTAGRPIPGVKIDIWETDSSGHYDVQHSDRGEPSERCVMVSDADGRFWFKGIKPVSYPIPHDGPVGKLLQLLGRHCWRPAHVHFMFEKEGWDHLITYVSLHQSTHKSSPSLSFRPRDHLIRGKLLTATLGRALYLRGDPYETSDAVFGVKKSLVIDLDKVDKKTAEEYGVPEGTLLLKQDFVLITEKESLALRDRLAEEALKNLGLRMKLVDHLPVPDVD